MEKRCMKIEVYSKLKVVRLRVRVKSIDKCIRSLINSKIVNFFVFEEKKIINKAVVLNLTVFHHI